MNVRAILPPTSTRVERSTRPDANRVIRLHTDAQIARLERAEPVEFVARLNDLENEWDIERVLQTNASLVVLLGVALSFVVDRRFVLLPAAVFSFFAQHALQGWCPPVPLFRARGVRTIREIERERYAVKALRGDFDRLPSRDAADVDVRVRAILAAIDA